MALARQYAPAHQQQPQLAPPTCEVEQPGPENAWGYEQLLGGQSELPGTGGILGAFSARHDDSKLDDTLGCADEVLARALPELRGAGDSEALADAEATALLRTHLESLIAERDAAIEEDPVLDARIEDHRDRLQIAVELVDAEYNAWQALAGIGIAQAVGPLLAANTALHGRLERVDADRRDFEQSIAIHLGELRGAADGLLDIALREQLGALADMVAGGASAIGGELGGLLGKGFALAGEDTAKILADLATGALLDQALSGGVEPVATSLSGKAAASTSLSDRVQATAEAVTGQSSEMLSGVLDAQSLVEELDQLSDKGGEALLGLEDACLALLMGVPLQLDPTKAELKSLSEGITKVSELVGGAQEDLETWRGVVAELRATGGPDLFAMT